ncbi:ThiS-like ubiquitin domain-containing protein, partial [Campylobacter coli]
MMRVKFNGKELDTAFKTSLEFFENISKNENDVW